MNSSIEIVMRKIGELKPYENNPRHNDMAVDAVAASIQQFGFKNPVIIDKDGVIVAGHTRYKAAKKLGITDIPCISADDLSDEQIKAFRLADNKTAELAEWDEDLLGKEMQGIINIDMSQFGFSVGEDELGEEMQDDKYTLKVKIPQYEITGECPEISDMLDSSKADELIQEVEATDIPEEIREFLIQAARRHNVFNYRNIAEYYAHAEPEVQKLFEKSALVIIDVNDAIGKWIAGEAVAVGDELTTNAEGKAVKAAAGNFITAVALSAATEAGSVVKVQLIKAGYKPKE